MLKKKCHFIGIGGIGMSALAEILIARGFHVSGSDLKSHQLVENLRKKGAEIFIGHHESQIPEEASVVFSSDIQQENPEFKEAMKKNLKIYHRSDLLFELMKGYKTLAITGTHGKTTTTALLASIFEEGNLDPSFMIGGIPHHFNSNGRHGNGEFFITEADESDGSFLRYQPFGAIITNIDFDHMNHFKTKENLIASFQTFFEKVENPDLLFFSGDDAHLSKIHADLKNRGVSYGFSEKNDLKIQNYKQIGFSSIFDLSFKGKHFEGIQTRLIGKHNALNAAAVFGLAHTLGISESIIRKAFQSFKGVVRRSEIKGEIQKVLLIDDYAHHPTEIQATLKGVQNAIKERALIAVYQPHRYSRTKDILGSFHSVFDSATTVIVTDIYAAGEKPIEGVTVENIVQELKSLKVSVEYIPRKILAKELISKLKPHDVVVSLGAGDITHLSDELKALHAVNPIQKLKLGLVFGGKSTEHEISLRSARYIATILDEEIYETSFFAISKEGVWNFGKKYLDQETVHSKEKNALSSELMNEIQKQDLFFPILHGTFGEDGTIQGFFEILNKPYVGCDLRASAITMDKVVTKRILNAHAIKTTPFIHLKHEDWKLNRKIYLELIEKELTFPVYIKPSSLGSSVGVHKALNSDEVLACIEDAFRFDGAILVENGIKGREIEFAVIGNQEVEVFPPGEVLTNGNLYSYAGKYLSNEIQTDVEAELPEEKIQEGISLARKAYLACGCQGLSRVDFFLDGNGTYWLNEINSIPGFTNISLYPSICKKQGLDGKNLIHRLVVLALEKKRRQNKYEI